MAATIFYATVELTCSAAMRGPNDFSLRMRRNTKVSVICFEYIYDRIVEFESRIMR